MSFPSGEFDIPASGHSGGLFLFGVIWLAILVPITLILSRGIGNIDSDIPEHYQWLIPVGVVSDGSRLLLRKSRQQRTVKEKELLLLSDLLRVALYPTGSSNAEVRYAVSFITATQVIPLLRWQSREIAQDVVHELRGKLSLSL